MQRRQFEEILDECISAYLSGRRSVEESLSLYPSISRKLEPLLRAAADTAEALQRFNPPPAVQERIRLNIVRAANERAAARALTREIDLAPRSTRRWGWRFAAPAAAAVVALAVVSGLLLAGAWTGDEPGESSTVAVANDSEFAGHITNARRQLEVLQLKARNGQTITAADLATLVGATRRLAANAEPAALAEAEQEELEDILEEQLALLGDLNQDSGQGGDEIDDAVAATVSAAALFGIPITLPSPTGEPVATATASPAPTSEPGPSPQTSPSPSATFGPTPSPTTSAGASQN